MANLQPLIFANGWALPWMSQYNPETAVFVDAARNAGGIMIGGVIRENVTNVETTWRWLPVELWAQVCQIPFKSSVRYFDPNTGTWTTQTMYKSNTTAEGKLMDFNTGRLKGWFNCRIAFITV